MSADAGQGGIRPGRRSEEPPLVIKVVKGRAEQAELAAVTTVLLLARAAALAGTGPEHAPAVAGWSRPERIPHYRDPRARWAPRGR